EWILTKRCVTFTYMAPEVLMPPYHGEPANLWLRGIILVFLLTGGSPWKIASMECNEYVAWKDGKAGHLEPFVEFDHLAMDLIHKIIRCRRRRRHHHHHHHHHHQTRQRKRKLDFVIEDPGFAKGSPKMGIDSPRDEQQNKRLCCGSEVSTFSPPGAAHDGWALDDSVARLSRSQPEPRLEQHSVSVESVAAAMQEEKGTLPFSQPAHLNDTVLNSQLHAAQPYTRASSQNTFQILVRHMTRFCVCTDYKERIEKLCKLLDKLSYTWRICSQSGM
ncbi:hypothetical protein B7P43_G04356, partial [Cryptotermes secundus]